MSKPDDFKTKPGVAPQASEFQTKIGVAPQAVGPASSNTLGGIPAADASGPPSVDPTTGKTRVGLGDARSSSEAETLASLDPELVGHNSGLARALKDLEGGPSGTRVGTADPRDVAASAGAPADPAEESGTPRIGSVDTSDPSVFQLKAVTIRDADGTKVRGEGKNTLRSRAERADRRSMILAMFVGFSAVIAIAALVFLSMRSTSPEPDPAPQPGATEASPPDPRAVEREEPAELPVQEPPEPKASETAPQPAPSPPSPPTRAAPRTPPPAPTAPAKPAGDEPWID